MEILVGTSGFDYRDWRGAFYPRFIQCPSRPTCSAPLVATTDWTYLRMHEGRASPRPCYGRTALRSWADRLANLGTLDGYVYFNNDHRACAPYNARTFERLLARRDGEDGERVATPRLREVAARS